MRYKIVIVALLFSPAFLFSQDAVLSQYNSFPLYTNMAMAGSKGCSRVVMGTRLQWMNMNGGYRTDYFSYDQYFRFLRSGFGFQYYTNNESNGMITDQFFHFSFSPSISVGNWACDSLRPVVIKPAIDVGRLKYSFDWNKYAFGDAIDPKSGFIRNTQEFKNASPVIAPDFGAGMFVYGKNFFSGLYFQHITEPNVGENAFPAKLTLHGGYLLKGYSWLGDFILTPSFIYEQQGLYESYQAVRRTDLTLTAKYKKYIVGISGRLGSSFVCMGGFECKFFKIGYAYEVNTTRVGPALGSTHELTMEFNFAYRKEHNKIRTLDFPFL